MGTAQIGIVYGYLDQGSDGMEETRIAYHSDRLCRQRVKNSTYWETGGDEERVLQTRLDLPLGCFLAWLPRQGCLSSLWAASWRGFHVKDVFPAFGLLLGVAYTSRMYFQPLGCFLAWLPRQGCFFNLWAAAWLGFQ
ncbi:hypothetical protein Dimus_009809, partial [Dionaea muscipula]